MVVRLGSGYTNTSAALADVLESAATALESVAALASGAAPPDTSWRPPLVTERQRQAIRRVMDAAAHAANEFQPHRSHNEPDGGTEQRKSELPACVGHESVDLIEVLASMLMTMEQIRFPGRGDRGKYRGLESGQLTVDRPRGLDRE
jgi:hypothetical protein